MEHFAIVGGVPLNGRVNISGAKNAAVAIIPAAIIGGNACIIENLPSIDDVRKYVKVLEKMGAVCTFLDKSTLKVDSKNINSSSFSFKMLREMRASYYLIGALLSRFGSAYIPLPGGCNFGSRPIDQHIKGFEALGAKVVIEHGMVYVKAEKLKGASIYLDVASVGATINIMLSAIFAEGITTIENAAKEPHIVDCANFLNMCGANVKGAGTDVIRIIGVKELRDSRYTIIPDQIEAGTYMIASAITGGDVTVSNIIPKHMDSLSAKLIEMGCTIKEGDDYIRVIANKPLSATDVKTMYYPGFPTDLQPQMTALLSVAHGTSYITESVFPNRFQYVDEIMRLGVKIKIDGRMGVVEGPAKLTGASVTATDLRAGASLIMLALASKGVTHISNLEYIDRGYEGLEYKLKSLGASIERINGNKGIKDNLKEMKQYVS